MTIRFSSSFKRAYKKFIESNPTLGARFDKKMLLFAADPKHPSLQTHKLSGKMKDLWSFSIDKSIRVVFHFEEDGSVLLESIGTHDEVY
jgi:addiction module RelE/StbE family toxin